MVITFAQVTKLNSGFNVKVAIKVISINWV